MPESPPESNELESRISVLIADDHALVRAGFRAILEGQPGISVCGEAEDGSGRSSWCAGAAPTSS